MSDKNGGFAFPRPMGRGGHTYSPGQKGMTLRDYFAAKAMQGLVASNDEDAGDRVAEIPEYAYMIADAMLKERDKHV